MDNQDGRPNQEEQPKQIDAPPFPGGQAPPPPKDNSFHYGAWTFSKDFVTGLVTIAIAFAVFVIGPPLLGILLKIGKWLGVTMATLLFLVILTAIVGRVVNWLIKRWTQ